MGRKSKLTDKQWGDIVDKFGLDELLREAAIMENNERAATLMLRLVLACGDLPRMLKVPAIIGHRFEFSVGGGRIDLLLFHKDRSVSIVEVKAEFCMRVIAAGIGQLCMYAVTLPGKLHKSQQPPHIRRILCAHVQPKKAGNIIAACKLAGVEFAYIPSFKEFKSDMQTVLGGK